VSEPRRHDALALECQRLTMYVLGERAEPDVIAAYVRAHLYAGLESRAATAARDRALLQLASVGAWGIRAADAYSALLAKDSLLRRKLALIIGILESRGASAARVDTATGISLPAWVLIVALQTAASVVRIVGVACALPLLRLWTRGRDLRRGA
jgi:hypothetical protein